jgi:hypothetical protein
MDTLAGLELYVNVGVGVAVFVCINASLTCLKII